MAVLYLPGGISRYHVNGMPDEICGKRVEKKFQFVCPAFNYSCFDQEFFPLDLVDGAGRFAGNWLRDLSE